MVWFTYRRREWVAILACGHTVAPDGIRRWKKHTRRTCRECKEASRGA
ncbi:MAG TPA: hypothetical protein VGD74_11455 [Vulgatibacter sp.]